MSPASQRATSRIGPLAGKPDEQPALDVDALLDDRGTAVIVCCGSGGVGKTTTAASLALRAAERGRQVVVLTIDPARQAGPVDGHRDARQRASTGARRRRRERVARSTR